MTGGAVKAVVGARACVGCSYNLEGLSEDGVCPECGEAVARSLRAWTLAGAPVRFLEGLAGALAVVCVGIAMQLGGAVALGTVLLVNAEPLILVGVLSVGVGVLASWTGHLFLSSEDPGLSERQDRGGRVAWARSAIRNGVGWQMALGVVGIVAYVVNGQAVVVFGMAFGIAWWLRVDQMLGYAAWLAERGGATGLANTAARSRWALPIVVVAVSPFLPWLGLPLAGGVYLSVLWRLRRLVRVVVVGRS